MPPNNNTSSIGHDMIITLIIKTNATFFSRGGEDIECCNLQPRVSKLQTNDVIFSEFFYNKQIIIRNKDKYVKRTIIKENNERLFNAAN